MLYLELHIIVLFGKGYQRATKLRDVRGGNLALKLGHTCGSRENVVQQSNAGLHYGGTLIFLIEKML